MYDSYKLYEFQLFIFILSPLSNILKSKACEIPSKKRKASSAKRKAPSRKCQAPKRQAASGVSEMYFREREGLSRKGNSN